jgi:hypothetical protein
MVILSNQVGCSIYLYEECQFLGYDAHGGTYRLYPKGDSELGTLATSLIVFTMMIEVIRSSETSVLTRTHGVTCQRTTLFIVTAVKTSTQTYTCMLCILFDRLCGILVRIPVYNSRDPGFDSRRYQIFRIIMGLGLEKRD